MAERTEMCSTCQYWHMDTVPDQGNCLRYPPTAGGCSSCKHTTDELSTARPITHALDTCGEWKELK